MKANEKCISKWEKRLENMKRMQAKYGKYGYNNYADSIAMFEEIIKDLKRLLPSNLTNK